MEENRKLQNNLNELLGVVINFPFCFIVNGNLFYCHVLKKMIKRYYKTDNDFTHWQF